MNKGFLFVGGVIFAVYLYFTFWNIFQSHKKQKENNYPNLDEEEIFEAYNEANNTDDESN